MPDSSTKRKVRLFTCADLNSTVKAEIHGLFLHHADIRWINIDQAHITINFLGEASIDQIEPAKEIIAKIAAKTRSIPIKLSGVQVIRDQVTNKGTMIWIAVDDTAGELTELHKVLKSEFEQAGIDTKQKDRSYVPHILIGRYVGDDNLADSHPVITHLQNFYKTAPLEVKFISLYESIMRPEGAEHIFLGGSPMADALEPEDIIVNDYDNWDPADSGAGSDLGGPDTIPQGTTDAIDPSED
ncbi:MAG TPA: RNA 2',3'-cyclic phosphodiesterase [Flavobacterium sp.]|nr:RNA 2',3'-cyclic phosphodiesterase [Flavobacterium sp.]